MVKHCAILTCKNVQVTGDGITYHQFPSKDVSRKENWIKAIPPELIRNVTPTTYLCSLHFEAEAYYVTPLHRNILLKTAVPTIFKRFQCNVANDTETIDVKEEIKYSDQMRMSIGDKENESMDGNRSAVQTCSRCSNLSATEDRSTSTRRSVRDACVQTFRKRSKPAPREIELMKKVDMLQKRLKRRDEKITDLTIRMELLKKSTQFRKGILIMVSATDFDD